MVFNFENFEDNLKIKLFWDYLAEMKDNQLIHFKVLLSHIYV
jgi:hypothetical protein